jgi:hypothetical protein
MFDGFSGHRLLRTTSRFDVFHYISLYHGFAGKKIVFAEMVEF